MVEGTVSQNKHIVGQVERFDQKNEMFKRTRWDPALRDIANRLWSVDMPSDKEGHTRTDIALLNAGYFVERNFARGNYIHDTLLYSWYTEPTLVITGFMRKPRLWLVPRVKCHVR